MSLNLSNKNIEDDDNIFNEVNHPEKYTSLDLSHNLLTKLPKNLSQFSNLHTLNITNNKFKNYQEIATSLSTLPELQDLSIDLASQENVIIILTALPNLIKLNGQTTSDTTLQQSFLSQSNLTNIFPNLNSNHNNSEYKPNNNNYKGKGDISSNEETNIFEYIYKQLNNEEFNKKFQKKLRDEIANINKNLDIPNKLYNAIIVKSKLEIYSFILDEVLNLILDEDEINNNDISYIKEIKKIINIVKDKLKENQNILFNLVVNSNTNKNNEENKIYNNNEFILNKNSKEKIIPLSDLLSLLNEIFQYNIKQNEKNNKYNFAKETFFKSINPYLTTKYGLKSIALYWNNKIMEGINNYYKLDCEIGLFKDLIEGKIKESFYIKYLELKSSCSNIILKNLKEKNPHNLNSDINDILNEKTNGFISYEEWAQLIDNIFDYNNKKEIINQIKEFINKKNKEDERYQNKNESDIKGLNILYKDFIKFLLEI